MPGFEIGLRLNQNSHIYITQSVKILSPKLRATPNLVVQISLSNLFIF